MYEDHLKHDMVKFKAADENNDGKLSKAEFPFFMYPEQHQFMSNHVVGVSVTETVTVLLLIMFIHTVHCKSFPVEKFCSFRGSIGSCKTSSEIACAIGCGYTKVTSNRKTFPVNYSLQ